MLNPIRPRILFLPILAIASLAAACGSDKPPVDFGVVGILSFTAAPTEILPGAETELSWKVQGAKTIEIFGAGGVPIELGDAGVSSGSVRVAPSEETNFQLVAKAGHVQDVASVLVTFKRDGPKASITAAETRIAWGESTTLDWEASNANRVTIRSGSRVHLDQTNVLSGTLDVTPDKTTEYEITALGAGKDSAKVIVEVAPVIHSFEEVDPRRVNPGQRIELKWQTEGAETLFIRNADGFELEVSPGARNEGTARVTVGSDGLFTLTAARAGTEESRDLQIGVRGPPTVTTFEISPAAVTASPEAPVTVSLHWVAVDANKIQIVADPPQTINMFQKDLVEDTIELDIVGETTFTLTASSSLGEAVEVATVRNIPLPVIDSFRALPSRVGVNEAVQLGWETTGATSIRLEKDGSELAVEASLVDGQFEDRITADTDYRLVVVNEIGVEVEAEISVTVGAPIIESFEIAQAKAIPGQTLGFSWVNQGGTSLVLKDPSGASIPGCSTDSPLLVAADSCTVAAPTILGVATYQLEVSNGVGAKTTRSISLPVTDGPWITSFTHSPELVSAGQTATLSWTVENDSQNRQPTLALVDGSGTPISVVGKNPNRGSVNVIVGAAGLRSYTLTASTPDTPPATATTTVESLALAQIDLQVTPTLLDPSESTTASLSWTSTGGTQLELFLLNADGSQPAMAFYVTTNLERVRADSTTVSPPMRSPVVYRARVRNALGDYTTRDATIQVAVPAIQSFTTSASNAPVGGTVTLSWITSGGVVSIDEILDVSTSEPFADISALPNQTIAMTQCNSALPSPAADPDEGCKNFSFPAGFTFPYDGSNFTSARGFVNGFLSFDTLSAMSSAAHPSSPSLPNSTAWKFVHLAPLWANLKLSALPGSGVSYALDTDPLWGDVLHIQWRQMIPVPTSGNQGPFNFGVSLYEGGTYDVRYGNMTADTTITSAFRGWQSMAGGQPSTNLASLVTAAQGGASNRSFRRVVNAPSTGSVTMNVRTSKNYTLKVTSPAGAAQQTVRVNVP